VIPESHFLILGAVLFCVGLFGALTRRNAVGILMSIELMINAANINFVTFNSVLGSPDGTGQIFALFEIALAAAASVVGLVLVVAVYRNAKSIFVDTFNLMKW